MESTRTNFTEFIYSIDLIHAGNKHIYIYIYSVPLTSEFKPTTKLTQTMIPLVIIQMLTGAKASSRLWFSSVSEH